MVGGDWLQFTLMMHGDGVVERNAVLDWLAFENLEKTEP